MDIIDQLFLNQITFLPHWAVWSFIIVAAILATAFYLFPKQINNFSDKYHVSFIGLDNAVRRIAMLAVRLYVVKRGIEDTRTITHMRAVSQIIDTLYPKNTGVKLSELVEAMNQELEKRYGGSALEKNKEIVEGITTAMVSEIVKVGDKVQQGDTVAYVACMAQLLPVIADKAGCVYSILLEDNDKVEYGTPIIKLT